MIIAVTASTIGCICGVGGGIMMKPLIDLFNIAPVSTAGFLSGSTVLAMTTYTTAKDIFSKTDKIDFSGMLPLAVGAAIGGLLGNSIFGIVKSSFSNVSMVGVVQSAVLALISVGTILYTLKKQSIKTHRVSNKIFAVLVGLALGCISSFLGIGGGPINLIVLSYFFSLDSKKSVQYSLFIILFSQFFNLMATIIGGTVPPFAPLTLILMVIGGIGGGIVGKKISSNISGKTTDKLFVCLLLLIIIICFYNIFKVIYS